MEALWIAVAFALGLAVRQVRLPPLVGYLAAGFLINALGYGHEGGEILHAVAHVGVLLLLFTVGLKLRFRNLLQPEVWGGTLLHLALNGLLLSVFLHWLGGMSWTLALIVGATLGFSSTVIAAKVLEEKRELRAFHGRVAIGILIVQDLAAVALLSFSTGEPPSPLALLILALPLLRPLLRHLLQRTGHDELLILFGLLLALVIGGGGFEHVGLSSELGALVLGALLAGHPKASELSHALWGLKEIFLVGFFLEIGLSGLPTLAALQTGLLLLLFLPIKLVLYFAVLVVFKLRARSAFLTGLSLATYSEFALIVMQVYVKNGTLGEDWLVVLAITVALSFVLAAPLNRFAHRLYARWETRLVPFELHERHPDEQPITLGAAGVLILGMGPAGGAAYDFLKGRGERVVGFDSDPGEVERHLREGRRVVYADAEDPGLWHNLRLEGIKAVILTMPDTEAKLIATRQLRQHGYQGLISAATHYAEEEAKLGAAGADLTFDFLNEAGVGLAGHTWEALYQDGDRPGEAP